MKDRSTNSKHTDYLKISKNFSEIEAAGDSYDVIIIGSGYGGAIAASRWARAGKSVCVLERGEELSPGQYPTNLTQMREQLQIHTDSDNDGRMGDATALFDLRVNEDMSVLVGCGVGGTSLINANVSLEAHKGIFNKNWPAEFRRNPNELDRFYRRARERLGANSYPSGSHQGTHYKKLNKLEALGKSARVMDAEVIKPCINVHFEEKVNWAGVKQYACTLCGDCCTGCNVGAKNTTLMNYLPDAVNFSAKIFNCSTVRYIAKNEGKINKGYRWKVRVFDSKAHHAPIRLYAKNVIVAAGTLGSSAIMLLSQKRGLSLSKKLGSQFSGNGNVLAFGYNACLQEVSEDADGKLPNAGGEAVLSINAIGLGDNRVDDKLAPGPCITGLVDLRNVTVPSEGLVVEEAVLPGPLGALLPLGFAVAASQQANFTRYGPEQYATRLRDTEALMKAVRDNVFTSGEWCYKGPLSRTQTYISMSDDNAEGKLNLSKNDDCAVISWPGAGTSDCITRANDVLARMVEASQGQLVTNPLWQQAFGYKLFSVHPLGGCPMGDNAECENGGLTAGVVNHKCEVFCPADASSGGRIQVHEGLYICDGSVIPAALGVNPLLTISAITERACDYMLGVYKENESFDPYKKNANSKAIIGSSIRGDAEVYVDVVEQKSCTNDAHELAPATLAVSSDYCRAVDKSLSRRKNRSLVKSEEEAELWRKAWESLALEYTHYDKELGTRFAISEITRGYLASCSEDALERETIASPYDICERRGKSKGNYFTLTLFLEADSADSIVNDREYWLNVAAGSTLKCKQVFTNPLKVKRGRCKILSKHLSAVDCWECIYELELESNFFLRGIKTLRFQEGSHWWKDISELRIEIYDGYDASGKLRGLGRGKFTLQDFLRQLTTASFPNKSTRIVKGQPYAAQLEKWFEDHYRWRFGSAIADIVFRAYGGILAAKRNQVTQEKEKPRKLQAPLPQHYKITAEDGVGIVLTRYDGRKNQDDVNLPIIVAAGLGMNASCFATPTVALNFVEFLTYASGSCAQNRNQSPNFDLWLLDHRGCPNSGSSTTEFSIDDIARQDWRAAIEFILKSTGASEVQIVAHCAGSLSLLMALAKGWVEKSKIRSIVSSQLTLHPVTKWWTSAFTDAGFTDLLCERDLIEDNAGVINPNPNDTSQDKDFDDFICRLPVLSSEVCNNPVCKRVSSLFGPSFLHSNLNSDTHNHLGDWFQKVHVKAFYQMSEMFSRGFAVDKNGQDVYVSSGKYENVDLVDRLPDLSLPIYFIAGMLNTTIDPQTSLRTFEWLCKQNKRSASQKFYQRDVFEGYGHSDCFIGMNASRDVFPAILESLLYWRS